MDKIEKFVISTFECNVGDMQTISTTIKTEIYIATEKQIKRFLIDLRNKADVIKKNDLKHNNNNYSKIKWIEYELKKVDNFITLEGFDTPIELTDDLIKDIISLLEFKGKKLSIGTLKTKDSDLAFRKRMETYEKIDLCFDWNETSDKNILKNVIELNESIDKYETPERYWEDRDPFDQNEIKKVLKELTYRLNKEKGDK